MDEGQHHLEYASPPKPDTKWKDMFRLALIGTIFAVVCLAVLFWWMLFR